MFRKSLKIHDNSWLIHDNLWSPPIAAKVYKFKKLHLPVSKSRLTPDILAHQRNHFFGGGIWYCFQKLSFLHVFGNKNGERGKGHFYRCGGVAWFL